METEPTMCAETAASSWWRSRAGWCLLGIVLIATGLAPAAEIVVEGGCTLPDAITAANNDAPAGGCPAGSGADVIQLTGDVVLTSVDNNEVGDNGLPVVTTDITIVGGGSTIERDAAAPAFRIFRAHFPGSLALTNVTVANGLANGGGYGPAGGAVSIEQAPLTITDSTLSGNSASTGGAVYVSGGFGATLVNTTVSGNSAGLMGGGLAVIMGDISLVNSTVSGNSAANWGGGMTTLYVSSITLTNTTVTGNSAGNDAGGIYNGGVFATGFVYLSGSILANNAGGNCGGYTFQIEDQGGNLADDTSCPAVPATLTGLDPVLADNGGPTLTHALLPASSAIDNAGACGLPFDQRGFVRDAACDSGSFEFGAVPPIPCADVDEFQARCNPAGTIQARVKMTDRSHSGETVTIGLDGTPNERKIFGSVASFQQPAAGIGPHTVSLDDPPGCVAPVVVNCPVTPDR